MIVVGIIIGICVGLATGDAIGGHVAYKEGIEDERRHWYIHAHCHGYDEGEFKEGGEK